MKIFYNDPLIKEDVEKVAKELGATVQHVLDLKELNSGPAKFSHPPHYVDLGGQLVVFVIHALLSGMAFEMFKKSIEIILRSRNKGKKPYSFFSLVLLREPSDDPFLGGHHFFIPTNLDSQIRENALAKIAAIMQLLTDQDGILRVDGSMRFFYSNGAWVLRELWNSANEWESALPYSRFSAENEQK